MRINKFVVLAFALGFATTRAAAVSDTCSFPTSAKVVIDDGKQFLQFWEVSDSPNWKSGLMPDGAGYWRFIQYVKTRMDVSEPARYLSPLQAATAADGKNTRLMLSGKVGTVAPINCLEALLFDAQAARMPMETHPTEFLAFVLRRDMEKGPGRLKIWFYTVNFPGIGRLGPIREAAESDVASGWKPYMNLHNHNFFFDRSPVVSGPPWPSAIDAHLMKHLALKNIPFEDTAVTNGFVTGHLKPDELLEFDEAK